METVRCYLCGNENVDNVIITQYITELNDTFHIHECLCTFKFLNPRPRSDLISNYYNIKNYHPHNRDKTLISKMYSVARKLRYFIKYKSIVSFFNNSTNIKHLDYGGGDGTFSKYLKTKSIFSVSFDPYFTKNNSLDDINKYDVITMFHSLEHIHDLDELFDFIDKRLKLNGKLVIIVPNFDAPERQYLKETWAAYDLPRHLYHFDRITLQKLLFLKGYKIVSKKRTFLDSIYICLLTKIQTKSPGLIKLIYIMIVSISKVIVKGPDFSSSLYYVVQKK